MAGIAGYNASAKVGTSVITEMGEWSLDIERSLEDDTEFGDIWENAVPTIGRASGSISGRWDVTATQQAALQNAMLDGTTVALRLYTDATHYYSGNAYISSVSFGANVSGLVEAEFSFQFNGAVTYT